MQGFKCEKCKVNSSSQKCEKQMCGKCCVDSSCSGHPQSYARSKRRLMDKMDIPESDNDDYNSEMEYDAEIIDEIAKIFEMSTNIPKVLTNVIIDYIDNSPICGVCENYCDPGPCQCENCKKYICDDCCKTIYVGCDEVNCSYCKSGRCFNNRCHDYCEICYPDFVIKCEKCESYRDDDEWSRYGIEAVVITKCSVCNRRFCLDCGKFNYIRSECGWENCKYCEKGNCRNVRIISQKCKWCSKNRAFDHILETNVRIKSGDLSDEDTENENENETESNDENTENENENENETESDDENTENENETEIDDEN